MSAESYGARVRQKLMKNRLALAGIAIVLGIGLLAILAPWIAPFAEETQDPSAILQTPTWVHLFGTDRLGRDLLSRCLYGARVSILVATVTTLIAMVLGTVLGAVSGWVGGRTDNILMRFVDVVYSFPDLLLIIIISVVVGQSVVGIILSLSLVSWVTVARVVRGEVLAVKSRPFVEAARALGFPDSRILLKQILPHTVAPVMVTLTFRIPAVILAESTLSFIGLGIQPPASSWGTLASQGWTAIAFYPHLILFPAALVFVTILGFNWMGDGLRDAMDVRL
jgi:oligopeptide transport system permease protein